MKKLLLLYQTVKNLKFKQVQYQLIYRLSPSKAIEGYLSGFKMGTPVVLDFVFNPPVFISYLGENTFEFLNIKHHFHKDIDWNFDEFGALWNYNLQYLNFLYQEDIDVSEKLRIINSLYNSGIKLEPYPVSLRSINFIRFICKENIQNQDVLQNLYAELNFLSKRLEFHILGNHLLENAFALMMGGAFFSNKEWIRTAQGLLKDELKEQILPDGAHFELSPMYHQIILFRVMELYDWYGKWEQKEAGFLLFLKDKAEKMLAWLQNISFKNGSIPHFNDSADGVAYSTARLLDYGKKLKLECTGLPLNESGYRAVNTGDYELRIDFAQIGPSYQPGHAHADALSFILYYKQQPLFIEQGTSTYTIGERRSLERSTQAHNAVVVADENQSQVWSGFRVGKRAKTTILQDDNNRLKAFHDGYKKFGVQHTRSFDCATSYVLIEDDLKADVEGKFYLHIHPDRKVTQMSESAFVIDKEVKITFFNALRTELESYDFAEGYNKYHKGKRIVVTFAGQLKTEIRF